MDDRRDDDQGGGCQPLCTEPAFEVVTASGSVERRGVAGPSAGLERAGHRPVNTAVARVTVPGRESAVEVGLEGGAAGLPGADDGSERRHAEHGADLPGGAADA
ncbi:hypothetical protein [Streptomyces sp. NPDC002666]